MSKNIELIDNQGNYSLAKRSDRKFPGLLIQGDTLSILYDDLEEIAELLAGGNPVEADFALNELRKCVGGMKESYEEMMDSAGMKLPYLRTR